MTERKATQVAAEQRYFEKRKSKPRLPGGYISEEENVLLERVAGHFSTKKEAIFKGLELLDKKLNKSQKNG